VLLKHDRHRALRRRQVFDRIAVQQYLPGARREKSPLATSSSKRMSVASALP
jgi:hypothetical protein